MDAPFPGLGTVINVVAVVVGSLLGMAVGHRLPERTRGVVTDALGLTTLLVAGLSATSVTDPALSAAVGTGVPVLVVLGSLLIGGITGSLLRIEARLEGLASVVQSWVARRFSDGLGHGIEQLALKSTLDLFAALAFASTFGVGVLMSAVSVAVVQGGLTIAGMALGSLLPAAHISALTATGGLLLVGIGFRLLRVREVPVGDLLPALVVAPILTQVIVAFR